MIEVILKDVCIGCMACVRACPNDVFDADEDNKLAVIARQEDCCTCYICEAYCPVDCMYVAPQKVAVNPDPEELRASGKLGSYRRAIGWDKHGAGSTRHHQPIPREQLFAAGVPGGKAANHRTDSYKIGEVNESHRYSKFDALAPVQLKAKAAEKKGNSHE